MTTAEQELKPCGHCESDCVFVQESVCGVKGCESEHEGFAVHCDNCMAMGPLKSTEAEAIAAWNRRPSGWVSVEERLPEDHLRVLVEHSGLGPLTSYRHDGTWIEAGTGEDCSAMVTHWQPLPDPPEAT